MKIFIYTMLTYAIVLSVSLGVVASNMSNLISSISLLYNSKSEHILNKTNATPLNISSFKIPSHEASYQQEAPIDIDSLDSRTYYINSELEVIYKNTGYITSEAEVTNRKTGYEIPKTSTASITDRLDSANEQLMAVHTSAPENIQCRSTNPYQNNMVFIQPKSTVLFDTTLYSKSWELELEKARKCPEIKNMSQVELRETCSLKWFLVCEDGYITEKAAMDMAIDALYAGDKDAMQALAFRRRESSKNEFGTDIGAMIDKYNYELARQDLPELIENARKGSSNALLELMYLRLEGDDFGVEINDLLDQFVEDQTHLAKKGNKTSLDTLAYLREDGFTFDKELSTLLDN